MMSTNRLEAFSDGVFAIAATLLVLELHVPPPGSGPLWPQLLAQWPSYAAYAVSFVTIGIMWVNHHALFALIRRVDRPILFLNLLLLLGVSITPFPTALLGQWIGDEEGSHVAAALYGALFFLTGMAFGAIWFYALAHHDLITEELKRQDVSRFGSVRRFNIGAWVYLMGIGVAFYSAVLSLLLYALVAVYYVAPTLPELGHSTDES
jgi:uncharacterized membrane protein